MATERIVIVVSENGTERVIKRFGTLSATARSTNNSVNFLRHSLIALGSGAVLKGLTNLLDTYQNLQNRLKLVSKSENELAFATKELLDIANRSRASFENTAELYARVALSAKTLGVTNNQVARSVETLNKAVILSGASVRESQLALIQLTQGLASGALKGDEMRAVLEQIPYVADLIAKQLGVTRGALRELGSQGQVTAEVMMKALLAAGEEVDRKFADTIPTIGQQFEVLKNQAIALMGALNERFQIIPRITALIRALGNNIETVGRVAFGGVLVLGVTKAISAINAMTVALAANPIGAIAVAIIAATTALFAFADAIQVAEDGAATLSDVLGVVWEDAGKDIGHLGVLFENELNTINGWLQQTFGDNVSLSVKGFLNLWAKGVDSLVGLFYGAQDAIGAAWERLPATIELVMIKLVNATISQMESMINGIIGSINYLAESALGQKLGMSVINELRMTRLTASQEATDAGKAIGEAFDKGFKESTAASEYVQKLLFKAEQNAQARLQRQKQIEENLRQGQNDFNSVPEQDTALSKRDIAVGEVLRRLEAEGEALRMNNYEYRIRADLLKIENKLRAQGVTLTEQERTALELALQQNEYLGERARIIDSVDGALAENARHQEILNDLIAEGAGNTNLYVSALRRLKIEANLANRDVMSGFKAGFLEVQDDISNFADQAAKTVTNAFASMEDSVVEFVQTGKFNFSSLVDSILADLTRLLFRQAMTGLFDSIGGGFGSALSGLFGGFKAEGGPVTPGKAYIVGERGPELFTPPNSGKIVPNDELAGGEAAAANVTVVNVIDPSEVVSAMNSAQGEQVILNVIRRNKNNVKQSIGA